MGSLDSALTRQALSKGIVRSVVDDTPIAFRLFYKGTGTVTSVTVDTDQDITLVTSDGGTDEYLLATYTTMGDLVDAINKDGIFEARIIDALRADSTASSPFIDAQPVTVGADENGRACWDALADTSATDFMTATLSPKGLNYETPAKGHRIHLKEIQYNVNVNAALANGVRVYLRRGATETQIWRAASVDATLTTINWASGEGKLTGNPDDEFVVRVIDTTSITDAAGNFVQAVGIFE